MVNKIINRILDRDQLKNLLFISKYRKLRAHEYKRWILIVIYAFIYFLIEALAEMYGIEFAIWDTALTISLVIVALVVGNLFCGWGCFIWRFQDAIDIVGRFLFKKRYNNFISYTTRSKLKWIRYVVLVTTLVLPFILSAFTERGSYKYFLTIFGICLNFGFLLCLVDSHAYCKYFCFTGSLFKIGGLRSKNILVRDAEKCINCNICSDVCLQDCNPAEKNTPINRDMWCTSCFRCKAVCPTGAIKYKKR
jgi:polyferredoxin